MKTKKSTRIPRFNEAVGQFMAFVDEAKIEIASNSHAYPSGPDCVELFWCDQFEAAYLKLRTYLKPLLEKRVFVPPAGTPFCSSPFPAESASKAVMCFLNPHEALSGAAGILTDERFVRMQAEMNDEIEAASNLIKDARVKPNRSEARFRSEIIELRTLILHHHQPASGEFNPELLSIDDMAKGLEWSQSKTSKRLKSLFDNKVGGGMMAYKGIFCSELPPNGFRNRFEDETVSLDGLWLDRRFDDDEEDDENEAMAVV